MKLTRESRSLIRKYVSEVIKEDMGDYGVDTGGMGAVYGSGSDLFKTFIKPFTDVIGTVAGKTKEVIRSGLTVLNVAFEGVMTTFIPFLTDSYDEIFAKEKTDLAKIRSEYQSIYDATDEALRGDASVLAFMAFPGPVLAGKFAKEAPGAAKKLLSVATGGISDEYLGGSGSKKASSKSSGPAGSGIFDSYARAYNKLINEAEDSKETSLADAVLSKKFVQTMLNKSPEMGSLSRKAQETYRGTLNSVYEQIKEVMAAKSIADIQKITGKKVEGIDQLKDLPSDEKQSAVESEKKFLDGVKQTAKKLTVERLKNEVAPVAASFGDEHPFVKDYQTVISKIEAL